MAMLWWIGLGLLAVGGLCWYLVDLRMGIWLGHNEGRDIDPDQLFEPEAELAFQDPRGRTLHALFAFVRASSSRISRYQEQRHQGRLAFDVILVRLSMAVSLVGFAVLIFGVAVLLLEELAGPTPSSSTGVDARYGSDINPGEG